MKQILIRLNALSMLPQKKELITELLRCYGIYSVGSDVRKKLATVAEKSDLLDETRKQFFQPHGIVDITAISFSHQLTAGEEETITIDARIQRACTAGLTFVGLDSFFHYKENPEKLLPFLTKLEGEYGVGVRVIAGQPVLFGRAGTAFAFPYLKK